MNKEETTVSHRTIKISKKITSPLNKVFSSISNVSERTQWSAPKGDEIKYLRSNFKEGGKDIFKCGSIGSLDFRGYVHYEDIIKNKRIINTETVFYKKQKMASSLITTEFFKVDNHSTIIKMTIQVASYCGEQMLKGCETGYKSSLRNLKEYLEG